MRFVKLLSKYRYFQPLIIAFLLVSCSPAPLKPIIATIKDDSLCQFTQGYCEQTVDDVIIKLLITPINTPSEKPLTVNLMSSEIISDINIRIEGRDMFMGIIPIVLNRITDYQYGGQLIYGSCSSHYMVWRAIVSFTLRGQTKIVIFDFLADNE
ncbi:hypothetical protein HQQ94_12660 [Shewanella sp. VB17]|uniref:hypothetical protein n=1 Tax=Shewanella sp. VB17 TaxID=2739432 RepID=UPI0015664F40|nr:hypothetical protein [Shewanella sp. VB17]NRD74071.1 hypothetical protein [Shewanella sp. VB17]